MKIFYICSAILIFIARLPSMGQCIADAGVYQVACVGMEGVEPINLGGDPAAIGGTPPYTYTWDALYTITIGSFTITMTASDFLDDTTLANPTIKSYWETDDLIKFHLTVTDSENNTCRDTTSIKFSLYYLYPDYFSFNINQGESVYLNWGTNLSGGIPPYYYLWRPNHGLTDSTSLSFWAKPDHSIAYYVTMTDSAGCSMVGPYYYYIYVTPVSVPEQILNTASIKIFPNPCNDLLTFTIPENTSDKIDIEIYDTMSRLLIREKNLSNEFSINVSTLNPGFYFYKVKVSDRLLDAGKFIVNR
jgi:hypothetical protein